MSELKGEFVRMGKNCLEELFGSLITGKGFLDSLVGMSDLFSPGDLQHTTLISWHGNFILASNTCSF